MDQKDWILIKTLHEEKNITRTAERLYVSQPSLSYRLKNLEEEFGVTLFSKRKKELSLHLKVSILFAMRKICGSSCKKQKTACVI